jgi:hypothetical protein
MNTPVVLTIFNRPADVRRVFDAIRAAKPKRLFVIGDAPRNEHDIPGIEACKKIIEEVNWECDVKKNYAETNMGPRLRLSSGISWVFEQVDRAIILEHDCLPDPSFFSYCEELLERYKDDERVMHIGGTNFHQKNPSFTVKDSYYFSIIPLVWGFATWARAWRHYDVDMKQWPKVKESGQLKSIFKDPVVLERWQHRFEQYYRGEAKSWDGQWAFACVINRGLCINPVVNLVTNIGFSKDAYTTKSVGNELADVPLKTIKFPLRHPTAIVPDHAAEAYIFTYVFDINRYPAQKVRWFFRSRFPALYGTLKRLLK